MATKTTTKTSTPKLIARLAKELKITQTQAKLKVAESGYKMEELADGIVDKIIRDVQGIEQNVIDSSPVELPTESEPQPELVLSGISVQDIGESQSQIELMVRLCQKLQLDPQNIPESEVEFLKQASGQASNLQQSKSFVEQARETVETGRVTDFKTRSEQAFFNGQLEAEIESKMEELGYYQSRLQHQQNRRQHSLDSGSNYQQTLLKLTQAPQLNLPEYQQQALGGQSEFEKKQKYLKAALEI